jgi:hypothetical protein
LTSYPAGGILCTFPRGTIIVTIKNSFWVNVKK